jgi:diguanylate cyclase (GGDEF)-like protein
METDKNSVLIVDDEKANIIALAHILSPEYTVYAANNGRYAITLAGRHLPDIILLDILMPEMDGYEVLSILRNDEKTREIPVIFVTGLGSSDDEERGLDLGAADYISKPFSSAIVKLRVRNLIQNLNLIDTVKLLSKTDQLTGVSNRRDFDYRMQLAWEHAKRNKMPLSVLLIDIDDFKKYNDTYGHLQGDAALRAVAKAIDHSLRRSTDLVARWGGEEFVALLLDTNLHGALEVAESIRKNVEGAIIPYVISNAANVNMTVSIGISTHTPTQETSAHDLIARADKALYTAKEKGKNRICAYEETGG